MHGLAGLLDGPPPGLNAPAVRAGGTTYLPRPGASLHHDRHGAAVPFDETAFYSHVAAAGAVLAQLSDRLGRHALSAHECASSTNSETMAWHIEGQQAATAVASTSHRCVLSAASGAVSAGLLARSDGRLRPCCPPRALVVDLHDLARRQAKVANAVLDKADMHQPVVLAASTSVRSVSVCSAQLLLVRRLKQTDVLFAGATGMDRAVQQAPQLDEVPGQNSRHLAPPHGTYTTPLSWTAPAGPPPPVRAAACSASREPRRSHTAARGAHGKRGRSSCPRGAAGRHDREAYARTGAGRYTPYRLPAPPRPDGGSAR